MQILKHRVLHVEDIDPKFGIEVDVRDYNNKIVVSHDIPTSDSIQFSEFLKSVNPNQLVAINIKSSGIEYELHKILQDHKKIDYFTFDWSIPALMNALKSNLICAFRQSEFEKDIFQDCSWVFIDTFQKIWYNNNFLRSMKNNGYKIALVSPELHNRKDELEKFREIVNFDFVDAICTDFPDMWYK